MSPERTNAYGRVIHTLENLGPSKLQLAEQERIRFAADSLIFSSDLYHDDSARDALADTDLLCHALVESGRWHEATAQQLAEDIRSCGPVVEFELEAA